MPRPGASNHPPQTATLPRDVSAYLFAPRFQVLFHQSHELVGYSAVDEAVVVAEREMNDGADRYRIVAFLVGDNQWLLGNAAHAHNRGVRLIDDGQSEDGAKLAGVGDGERGTLDVFGLELLGAGALAEVGDAALQA